MIRVFFTICLYSTAALALTGNLDGQDCIVDFGDFAVFAADYNMTDSNISDPNTDLNGDNVVDVCDLYVISENWLFEDVNNPCNDPPTANDVSVDYNTFTDVFITLDGGDENGDEINYNIQSLPGMGDIYDANGMTEANHLDVNAVLIETVPYELTGEKVVYYGVEPNDNIVFNYKAFDGEKYSQTAAVTVDANGRPYRADFNVATCEYYREAIDLTATLYPERDGEYVITALPVDAWLIDDNRMGGIIKEQLLPYKLKAIGSDVVFTTDTNGSYQFSYYVSDGYQQSDTITVDVNVYANPADSLNYNGENRQDGYLEVEYVPDTELQVIDGNLVMVELGYGTFDLKTAGGAVAMFVKTRTPDCWLLKKIGTNGTGWELLLKDGVPYLNFYLEKLLHRSVTHYERADDGKWNMIGFMYKSNDYPGTCLQFDVMHYDNDGASFAEHFTMSRPGITGDYSNSAKLKVSTRFGAIDRLRYYSGLDPNVIRLDWAGATLEGRNDIGDGFLASPPGAAVRFMFTENVIDEVAGVTGEISDSNKVKFVPLAIDKRNIVPYPSGRNRDGWYYNLNGEYLGPDNIDDRR